MTKKKNYYVAGGVYRDQFKLVTRTGERPLPYVATEVPSMLSRTTRHHSHYYHLNETQSEAELVLHNWEADGSGVKAPTEVRLSLAQRLEIRQAIAKGVFYD